MDKIINPVRKLQGVIKVPGDNPISHRIAFLSAVCEGPVEITNYSSGMEAQSALICLSQLGVEIERPEG